MRPPSLLEWTLAALLPIALTLPTAGQSVLVVDAAAGAGSAFTTIGAAYAAAADGDVLLVREGTYLEDIRINGKGIVLQAESGATVTASSLDVRSVPAGSLVAVRGLTLTRNSRAIEVGNLGAVVWLEDVRASSEACLVVSGAPHVVLRNVDLQGRFFNVTLGEVSTISGAGSDVSLFESSVVGPAGIFGFGLGGLDALWLGRVRTGVGGGVDAWLSGCTVIGGDGGTGRGGDGAVLEAPSRLDVLDSMILGGAGSPMGRTVLSKPGSSAVAWPEQARSLVAASPIRSGETTTLTFRGVPGDSVWRAHSRQPGAQKTGPQWTGPWVLGTGSGARSAGVLGPSGSSSTTVTAPSLAGRQALPLFVQPLARDARTGRHVAGAPTLVVFLDGTLFPSPSR